MATKRKRGDTFHYVIKRKGILPKPFHISFHDEAEGDSYVAQLEREIDSGFVPDELLHDSKAVTTLSQAIRSYLDKVHVGQEDSTLLAVLDKRVGSVKLSEVNYAWAEKWVAGMRVDLAPSTVRHYVGALARCIDWLVRGEKTMLVSNPLRMLPKRYATSEGGKKDTERDRRLQAGEEERILTIMAGEKPEGKQRPLTLNHADDLVLLFKLALETAMRMREMFTLDLSQVDIAKRTIFLDKTKNGDKRQVPLSSVALSMLQAAIANIPQGDCKLFPWWDGRKESLHATTAQISQQFSRIFKASGCADLHFHDLRHEATSRLFERTQLSDLQISAITGHRDPRMLKRYANLRGSDLAVMMW